MFFAKRPGQVREYYMIKTDIKLPVGYTDGDIKEALLCRLPIFKDELEDIIIVKRALDVRCKSDIHYNMTVAVRLSDEREAGLLKMRKKVSEYERLTFNSPVSHLDTRPVVVGSGPSGLFAAMVLAESGARPYILERGLPVEERLKKIELYNSLSLLDPECNVQFGEGGAGTYSDGKLKSGAPDKYKMKVLSEFVSAGADPEILYSASAHLGTDKLPEIVRNIREKIISLGGEFIFSAKLVGIRIKKSSVSSAVYEKNGCEFDIPTDNIILATGHSARDTFRLLEGLGVPMEARGFGIGMRIEHPREYINKLVYGDSAPTGIETASYRLVTHLKNGRSVYSFCMCPGGSVVAAASENGGIVTNGMSEYARDGDNSNAAFLVSVSPDDFNDSSALAGLDFQRAIEQRAYELTASYRAPAIKLCDFEMKKHSHSFGEVSPSYPIGTEMISPEEYLPEFAVDSLRASIREFEEWMPGFCFGDAVMTGPETRSTSPVRVLRNEKYESPLISGLYPSGEGAGYAGGIVSSAVDGIKCAEAMLQNRGK